jgi:hypothetical protein
VCLVARNHANIPRSRSRDHASRRVETRAGVARPVDLWQNKVDEEMALSAPIWIVALALAACAPWCVRAIADGLEGRVRRRTESLVARAVRAAVVTGVAAAASDPHPQATSEASEPAEG